MNNGYYYTVTGLFDKQITNGAGDKNEVYVFDKKDAKGNYVNPRKLGLKYKQFVDIGKTIYGESSAYNYKKSFIDDELSKEMFAIASVHKINKLAYGINSEQAKIFERATPVERNGTNMQLAVGATINAEIGGKDYSNGATAWDGTEQATAFPADFKQNSNGTFRCHRNIYGWEISQEHYDKWKAFIGKSFVDVGRIYYATTGVHKGKIVAKSTAVYKGTIFWKR